MIEDAICILGYRPEDDSWESDGRRTYIHDDNATRAWLSSIGRVLGRHGFYRRAGIVTSAHNFYHADGRLIAIEIGGPDTSGHYLHLMKSSAVLHEHV